MKRLKYLGATTMVVVGALLVLGWRTSYRDLERVWGPIIAARGDIGTGSVNKFGFNDAIAATEESVYEGNDFGGAARIIMDTTAQTIFISSDDAADAGIEITVEGLDANWDYQTVSQALGAPAAISGTAFQQLPGTWMRINRAYNSDTTGLTGDVYVHIDSVDTGTDGVPDIPATHIRTMVTGAEEQTLQAAYTVGDQRDGWLTRMCLSVLSSGAGTNVTTARMRVYRDGSGTVSRTTQIFTADAPGTTCVDYNPPIHLDSRDAIDCTGQAGGAGEDVACTFDIILTVDDD